VTVARQCQSFAGFPQTQSLTLDIVVLKKSIQ
jgi:hypothetical protein